MESYIKQCYDTTKNEDKKHIVLWSGGCDSTLLLYELLDAYGSKNVIAMSYTYPWLDSIKAKIEHNHREAFKSKMKLIGDKFADFTHNEFEITMTNHINPQRGMHGLPQALAWLFMVPMYADTNSYIYAGYVKSDSFTAAGFNQHYTNIFDSVNKLIGRSNITLRLPYIDLSKEDIIDRLIKYNLYDITWYCEMPTEEHAICTECHPCRTHISALTYLSLFSNDDYVKLTAAQKIEQIKLIQHQNKNNSDGSTDDIIN